MSSLLDWLAAIVNSVLYRVPRMLTSVDIHPPDIIEVMSGTQVICFANTVKETTLC
jgi:hypothetical protein